MTIREKVWKVDERSTVPHGVFKGHNFVTPDVVGYFKVRMGYAELSKGTAPLSGSKVWGVTVRNGRGQHVGDAQTFDLHSKMHYSYTDAMDQIEELS